MIKVINDVIESLLEVMTYNKIYNCNTVQNKRDLYH